MIGCIGCIDPIDTIDHVNSYSLRPCYNTFSKEQQHIIKGCKPLDYTTSYIIKNKQNNRNRKRNRKELNIQNIQNIQIKREMIYNFVYTNLKRLDIVKSIEEFKSDSEDEEYDSDFEYN